MWVPIPKQIWVPGQKFPITVGICLFLERSTANYSGHWKVVAGGPSLRGATVPSLLLMIGDAELDRAASAVCRAIRGRVDARIHAHGVMQPVELTDSYRCSSPFSGIPGSSSNWIDEAGPRSGSFHSLSAQTTFFAGVTSSTCIVPGQVPGSFKW